MYDLPGAISFTLRQVQITRLGHCHEQAASPASASCSARRNRCVVVAEADRLAKRLIHRSAAIGEDHHTNRGSIDHWL